MRRAVVRSRCIIWPALGLVLLAGCGEGLLSGGDPGLVQDDAGVLPPGSSDGMELELDGGRPLLDGELPAPSDEDAAAPDPDAGASASSSCPQVEITTDGRPANVRPAPNTSGAPVGTLQNGDIVDVLAITQGETLDGLSTWYKIKSSSLVGYVFETLATCTTQPAPTPTPTPTPTKSGFYLPFPCGKKVKVTQGNNTSFSHTGASKYAFDFSLGIGTKMLAMAPGTVSYVYNKTKPGDPCYSGGGPSCISKANLVWVKHADGTQTIYAHLSSVAVSLNQKVTRGQKLGLSGSSGYSTGPHAHVARMKSCCQTIPLKFQDVPGTGVPKTGDYVTSGNCP